MRAHLCTQSQKAQSETSLIWFAQLALAMAILLNDRGLVFSKPIVSKAFLVRVVATIFAHLAQHAIDQRLLAHGPLAYSAKFPASGPTFNE